MVDLDGVESHTRDLTTSHPLATSLCGAVPPRRNTHRTTKKSRAINSVCSQKPHNRELLFYQRHDHVPPYISQLYLKSHQITPVSQALNMASAVADRPK